MSVDPQDNATPQSDGFSWTALVASTVAILTTLLTAVSTISGGIDRLWRNEYRLAVTAGICVLAGLTCAILATLLTRGGSASTSGTTDRRHGIGMLIAVALVLTATGVTIGFVAGSAAARAQEQPSVTASLAQKEGRLSLTGSVKASGLRARDRLNIVILEPFGAPRNFSELFRTAPGPDPSGHVNAQLDVALLPHDAAYIIIRTWLEGSVPPNCEFRKVLQEQGQLPGIPGCTYLQLPRSVKPQLAVNLEGKPPTVAAVLKISATNLPASQIVGVRVVGSPSRGKSTVLLRSSFAPDAVGGVNVSTRIPLAKSIIRLCIAAKAVEAVDLHPMDQNGNPIKNASSKEVSAACGVSADDATTWIQVQLQ